MAIARRKQPKPNEAQPSAPEAALVPVAEPQAIAQDAAPEVTPEPPKARGRKPKEKITPRATGAIAKRPKRAADRPYGEGLTKTIAFRVDDSEYQRYDAKCAQAGLSKSEFFRAAVLGAAVTIEPVKRPPKSPDYRKAEAQIRRAGNNINQIAHALNIAALAGQIQEHHAAAAVTMLTAIRRDLRAKVEQE